MIPTFIQYNVIFTCLFYFSKSHKLSSHAGFEPCLCFGDALVWWEWEGVGGNRSVPRTTNSTDKTPPKPPKPSRASHDFVRTHFHRSTQCDFCNKKVSFNQVNKYHQVITGIHLLDYTQKTLSHGYYFITPFCTPC